MIKKIFSILLAIMVIVSMTCYMDNTTYASEESSI